MIAAVMLLVVFGVYSAARQTASDSLAKAPLARGKTATIFGTTLPHSVILRGPKALSHTQSVLGEPAVFRLYNQRLPDSWRVVNSVVDHTPVVVSFKAAPAKILSGRHDERLRRWFMSAPRDRSTWWVYYHEPENEVENGAFTADEFRMAWQHVAQLAASAHNHNLHATVVLMCWTVDRASGRNWLDYVTPGTVDVLAWDCYNHGWTQGVYAVPDLLLTKAVRASNQAGAGWGLAEWGSLPAVGDNDGRRRGEWVLDIGAFCVRERAAFATYFNVVHGRDYVLRDSASKTALRELMKSGLASGSGDPVRHRR